MQCVHGCIHVGACACLGACACMYLHAVCLHVLVCMLWYVQVYICTRAVQLSEQLQLQVIIVQRLQLCD